MLRKKAVMVKMLALKEVPLEFSQTSDLEREKKA